MIRAGLIDEFLDGFFSRIGTFFHGLVPDWLSDPFYIRWVPLGVGLIFIAAAIAWFFGALPVIGGFLRAIAGVIVIVVTFGLYAYRKGENDATARLQKRVSIKPKPKPPVHDGGTWPWQ